MPGNLSYVTGSWSFRVPTDRLTDSRRVPMACFLLRAMGIVHYCGGVYWLACPLSGALESSREDGEKLGCQCLHCVPDPSPRACWFCLCLPNGCPVSLAQI